MNNKEFERITESIVDGSSYNLSDEKRYEYILEVAERIGIGFYDAALIDNTINYCSEYVTNYDKKEIIETVIHGNYIPHIDDINETSYEIARDMGYSEIE